MVTFSMYLFQYPVGATIIIIIILYYIKITSLLELLRLTVNFLFLGITCTDLLGARDGVIIVTVIMDRHRGQGIYSI